MSRRGWCLCPAWRYQMREQPGLYLRVSLAFSRTQQAVLTALHGSRKSPNQRTLPALLCSDKGDVPTTCAGELGGYDRWVEKLVGVRGTDEQHPISFTGRRGNRRDAVYATNLNPTKENMQYDPPQCENHVERLGSEQTSALSESGIRTAKYDAPCWPDSIGVRP